MTFDGWGVVSVGSLVCEINVVQKYSSPRVFELTKNTNYSALFVGSFWFYAIWLKLLYLSQVSSRSQFPVFKASAQFNEVIRMLLFGICILVVALFLFIVLSVICLMLTWTWANVWSCLCKAAVEKTPLETEQLKESKTQYEIPDAAAISVFMDQVSNLIKWVNLSA